jgi:hypothetical protein
MDVKGPTLLIFNHGHIPKCLASAGIDPFELLEKSPLDLWEIFIELLDLRYGAGQSIEAQIPGPLPPEERNDR